MKGQSLERIFYVYLLFKYDGSPLWVGKGKYNRWKDHENQALKGDDPKNVYKSRTIRKTINILGELPKIKLAESLIEQEAFALEMLFIKVIGRYPNGPLLNKTDGGEGPTGLITSEERKTYLKEYMKGNQYLKGFKHSEESKKKIGVSLRKAVAEGRKVKPVFKNGHPFKGRHHTEEVKRILSEKKKGFKHSPESIILIAQRSRESWVKRKQKQIIKEDPSAIGD